MPTVRVSENGTFTLDRTIKLTDEEWADAVDPETGLIIDVNIIIDAVQRDGEGGSICAQCSGWGRDFTLTLDDDMTGLQVMNEVTGNVIYDDTVDDESDK